jgi:hypothetical protein
MDEREGTLRVHIGVIEEALDRIEGARRGKATGRRARRSRSFTAPGGGMRRNKRKD